MKRILFLFGWLLTVSSLYSQTASKILLPTERVHDFGMILEKKGRVSNTFFFKNTGMKSVVIEDVSAWCGCTTYTFTRTPIKPGEKGSVTVTYNPNNRPGFFSKEVVLLTESGKCYVRVWVKGTVVPYLHPVTEDYPYTFGKGLYMSLKVLAFSCLRKGEQQTIELRYANNTNRMMTLAFWAKPNIKGLSYINPTKIKANGRAKMNFTYTSSTNDNVNRSFEIFPVINGKKGNIPLMVTILKR